MSVLRRYNPDTQQWEILQGGVQGLQGPPVSLAKGSVATGAPGSSADFSITGTPPALKLNLTIPRGDVGPVGPTFGSDGSIIAAGRPDLPATMDSPTQAAVSSASTGTLFRSTDGASVGAWVWMKRPAGWAVMDGDTGWRDVSSYTNPAVLDMRGATSKGVFLRIIGPWVGLRIDDKNILGHGELLLDLPSGWGTSGRGQSAFFRQGVNVNSAIAWVGNNGSGGWTCVAASGTFPINFIWGQAWLPRSTNGPWPITLIGTPA